RERIDNIQNLALCGRFSIPLSLPSEVCSRSDPELHSHRHPRLECEYQTFAKIPSLLPLFLIRPACFALYSYEVTHSKSGLPLRRKASSLTQRTPCLGRR